MAKHVDFYKLGLASLSLAKRKALVAKYGIGIRSIYGDTFWTETIGERGNRALDFAKWLVTQGQEIDAKTGRGTALHVAASGGNLAAVEWLIAEGATVGVKADGETPLEALLSGLSNSDLEGAVPIATALVKGGAKITPAARKAVSRAYSEFDYSRAAMAPAFRKKCEAAATALCKLVGVAPPAPRHLHDGKSAIAVAKGSLGKQFEALWNHLVPAQGAAVTAQGEVVRIAGRINHELSGNGAANWDADYHKMAKAFARMIATETPVGDAMLAQAGTFVAALCKSPRQHDEANLLCKIAVAWVSKNPKPIKRGKLDYAR